METRSKKSVAVALLAIATLSIGILPGFAAPASEHYQVSTVTDTIQMGQSIVIMATIKQAAPNCDYSTLLSVTGPGGVSATDTITINTKAGGNGHGSAVFPDSFSGTANTNTAGTYTVVATFVCNYYSSGAATTTFDVAGPGPQHYMVATAGSNIRSGHSVRIIAATIHAVPSCAYSTTLSVTGPGGVSATDTVVINTKGGGNGLASAMFPNDFSGTANTNTPGTYTVTATFVCGYASGTATAIFNVFGK